MFSKISGHNFKFTDALGIHQSIDHTKLIHPRPNMTPRGHSHFQHILSSGKTLGNFHLTSGLGTTIHTGGTEQTFSHALNHSFIITGISIFALPILALHNTEFLRLQKWFFSIRSERVAPTFFLSYGLYKNVPWLATSYHLTETNEIITAVTTGSEEETYHDYQKYWLSIIQRSP